MHSLLSLPTSLSSSISLHLSRHFNLYPVHPYSCAYIVSLSISLSVCQTVFCICTFVSQALKHKIKKQFLNPNFSFQTPAIPTNQDCGAISVWPAVNAPVSYSLSVSVTHARAHTHGHAYTQCAQTERAQSRSAPVLSVKHPNTSAE